VAARPLLERARELQALPLLVPSEPSLERQLVSQMAY
jgi:hypothetical protein